MPRTWPAASISRCNVFKSPRDQTIDHVENFLDCCRSRKLPNGDVYIGHRSAAEFGDENAGGTPARWELKATGAVVQ